MSGEVQAAAVLGGFSESEQQEDARGPVGAPRRRRLGLGDWLLPAYTIMAFVFLMIPIAYTFVFSFNDSVKSNIVWRGFTFDKWLNVCAKQEVCVALIANGISEADAMTLIDEAGRGYHA